MSLLGPGTLENLCLTRYLICLESVCASYIHLITKVRVSQQNLVLKNIIFDGIGRIRFILNFLHIKYFN